MMSHLHKAQNIRDCHIYSVMEGLDACSSEDKMLTRYIKNLQKATTHSNVMKIYDLFVCVGFYAVATVFHENI